MTGHSKRTRHTHYILFAVTFMASLFCSSQSMARMISDVPMDGSAISQVERREDPKNYRASVGPGLEIRDNETNYSVNFGFVKRVSEGTPWFVGIDSGMSWSDRTRNTVKALASTTGEYTTLVRLLPTIYYKVPIGDSQVPLHPFFGLSLGSNLSTRTQVQSSSDGSVIQTTHYKMNLEVLVRLGVELDLTKSAALSVEPKMGWIGYQFHFLPQVSAVFSF